MPGAVAAWRGEHDRQTSSTVVDLIAGAGSAVCRRGASARPGSSGFRPARQAHSPEPTRDPVSMAMHIHSSFSEGIASMDAHLYQARRLGVDVVWWTEHDFRKLAHGYRTAVGFDGPQRARRVTGTSTGTRSRRAGRHRAALVRDEPANPDETGGKMQVVAAAGEAGSMGDTRRSTLARRTPSTRPATATPRSNSTSSRSSSGTDARVVVEIVSSYRPASAGRPAGQYRIQYRLGDPVGTRTEERRSAGSRRAGSAAGRTAGTGCSLPARRPCRALARHRRRRRITLANQPRRDGA